MFVVSFAPQQASAQTVIPAPERVDAWIEYTDAGPAMRIDFDFNRDDENGQKTDVDSERIVKTYRIDTRYRPNDMSTFSDWRRYVGYTNTGGDDALPCPVNVDNPNGNTKITELNRECAIATIWPNTISGPGEYNVRIVAEGRGGGEASSTVIESKGVEDKPGKARITSVTGAADTNDNNEGAFTVRWASATNAAKYIVQYVPAVLGFDALEVTEDPILNPNTLSHNPGGLEPQTQYLVRIIAVGTFGREGDPTDAVSVMTGGARSSSIVLPEPPDVDALVTRYDTNPTDGVISLAEANNAVAGQVMGVITEAELYALLDFYFNQ